MFQGGCSKDLSEECGQRRESNKWSENEEEKSEKGKKTETKVSGSI